VIEDASLRCTTKLAAFLLWLASEVFGVTSPLRAETPVVAAEVLKAYAANNSGIGPIVAWSGEGYAGGTGGHDSIYLFDDRRIFVSDFKKTNGRFLFATLTEAEFTAALATIRSHQALREARPEYVLTRVVHQPTNSLSLRIPNAKPLDVFVYGGFPPYGDSRTVHRHSRRLHQNIIESPRVAKLRGGRRPNVVDSRLHTLKRLDEFHTVLKSMIPTERLKLWDPGYVVISWVDFAYARNQGRPWPAEWPSFESPLVRKLKGYVIEQVMLFPSSHMQEFDAFRIDPRGSVSTPISGRLMHPSNGDYPLPNEAKWILHGTEAHLQSQAAEAKAK